MALGNHQAGWICVNVPTTGTKVQIYGNTTKDYSVNIEVTPAAAG